MIVLQDVADTQLSGRETFRSIIATFRSPFKALFKLCDAVFILLKEAISDATVVVSGKYVLLVRELFVFLVEAETLIILFQFVISNSYPVECKSTSNWIFQQSSVKEEVFIEPYRLLVLLVLFI